MWCFKLWLPKQSQPHIIRAGYEYWIITFLGGCFHIPKSWTEMKTLLLSSIGWQLAISSFPTKRSGFRGSEISVSRSVGYDTVDKASDISLWIHRCVPEMVACSQSTSSPGRRCPNVFAKSMHVLRQSTCCCHHAECIHDVVPPSLSWLSSASFPGYIFPCDTVGCNRLTSAIGCILMWKKKYRFHFTIIEFLLNWYLFKIICCLTTSLTKRLLGYIS